MRGKRATNEAFDWSNINFKKIGISILILVIVIVAIVITLSIIKNSNENEKNNIVTEQNAVQNNEKKEMIKQIDGYDVLGELIIDKIELKQYILNSTDDDAMEKGPVKLYGRELNQIGNFCIAGHNYEEIFARLKELEIGDEFYIIDQEEMIQDYAIKEITEVDPTDLNCLMQVDDKIQVTLITCIEGSTKRLVIKAERINIEV